MDRAVSKRIRAFLQHGFTVAGESGDDHAYGNCVFCGDEGRFYLNTSTKKWDCKKCGKNGGFKTWLKEVATFCHEHLDASKAKALSRERGLRVSAIKRFKIGWNPRTGQYILPVVGLDGDEVLDIRIWRDKKLMSTAGCKTALYGGDEIESRDPSTVYVCEGEWDKIAMSSAIPKDTDAVAVGLPGAGTLKNEWYSLFRGRDVIAVYDNDKAGFDGAKRMHEKLVHIVRTIRYVHWSSRRDVGFDLRDFYLEKRRTTVRALHTLLRPDYPGFSGESEPVAEPVSRTLEELTEDYSHEKVYDIYRKWLIFPDDDVTGIDIMFGTVLANRLAGDPLWMFIVAESGGMKSELLMSLTGCIDIYTATSLTPHALVSGANFGGGGDPSLIPKLNNKVLTIKDFTTILNLNSNIRDEVFGILRDAYDGRTEKIFGNGIIRSYESKFGILAGVTPAIEIYTEGHTALGERFLSYHLPRIYSPAQKQQLLMKAINNTTQEDVMRDELKSAALTVLGIDHDQRPDVPMNYQIAISHLAQWVALMRASIVRDKYTKEAQYQPFQEMPTRLSKQLTKLGLGVCMFKRKEVFEEDEYRTVKRVARSTVPSRTEQIIRYMYTKNKAARFNSNELSQMLKLPTQTVNRLVENLYMLGAVDKEGVGGLKTQWSLSEGILLLIEQSGVYKHISFRRA